MTVAEKLQIKAGQSVYVTGAPADVSLELGADSPRSDDPAEAEVVIVFCVDRAAAADALATVVPAASRDALTWVAYPKAGQLGTDLNRDSLARVLLAEGVQPVRQIAIDETWSALRFRSE